MADQLDQAQKNGVVLGLAGVTGATSTRHEIDELLLSDPDAFNVFLLALSDLQEKGFTKEKMAFYQVAGIHGLPTQLWDGVESNRKDRSAQWRGQGYCTHSMASFPTWHRPYLAMYEQTIFHKMRAIAEQFPDAVKPKYRAAVKRFRLPYWDYYRPRAHKTTTFQGITLPGGRTSYDYDFSLPQVFTVEEVTLRRTSDDKLVKQRNPLCRYLFPTAIEGGFDQVDVDNAGLRRVVAKDCSVRHPQGPDDRVGSVSSLNAKLNKEREGGTKAILDMIEHYTAYESFATNKQTTGPSGSLEDIHNSYHVNLGGSGKGVGWMSTVPTAAFDPVFWIHHCLIDRWCAIWQAAHPDKWFTSKDEVSQPCLPFRHPTGEENKYWVHNQVRDTKVFGYDYAETKGSARDVIARFKQRHEWSVRELHRDNEFQAPPPDMEPLDLSKAQVFQYTQAAPVLGGVGPVVDEAPQVVLSAMTSAASAITEALGIQSTVQVSSDAAPVSTDPVEPGTDSDSVAFTNMPAGAKDAAPPGIDESKYLRSWYIDNIVERLAYNGPFTVHYFIGRFDSDDVETYDSQPTNAGFNYVFTSSRELCDNCGIQAEEGTLVTSTAVITPMLLDYIKINQLADLTPEKVVPFLIANLKWRVVTLEGERKDPRTTPGFKIGVSSKLTPIENTPGSHALYQEYPQVIEEIIRNAS